MSRLNGWQRIWVALSVLWTLIVGGLTYAVWEDDMYVSHPADYSATPFGYKPSPEVVARMRNKSVISEDCVFTPDGFTTIRFDVTVPRLSSPVSLCFYIPSPKVGDRTKTNEGGTQEWDGKGWVPVLENNGKPTVFTDTVTKVGDEVEAEYKRAFAEEQRHLRMNRRINIALIWLIPPAVLYALGWTIGWIRLGFKGTGRT